MKPHTLFKHKEINILKISLMLSTSRDVWRIDSQITAKNYTVYTVNEFIYLGSAIFTKNDISLSMVSIGN